MPGESCWHRQDWNHTCTSMVSCWTALVVRTTQKSKNTKFGLCKRSRNHSRHHSQLRAVDPATSGQLREQHLCLPANLLRPIAGHHHLPALLPEELRGLPCGSWKHSNTRSIKGPDWWWEEASCTGFNATAVPINAQLLLLYDGAYSIITAPDYVWSRGEVGCLRGHHGHLCLTWPVAFRISQPRTCETFSSHSTCSLVRRSSVSSNTPKCRILSNSNSCRSDLLHHNHVSGITTSRINFGTPWAAKKKKFKTIGIFCSYILLQCGTLLLQNHISHSTPHRKLLQWHKELIAAPQQTLLSNPNASGTGHFRFDRLSRRHMLWIQFSGLWRPKIGEKTWEIPHFLWNS